MAADKDRKNRYRETFEDRASAIGMAHGLIGRYYDAVYTVALAAVQRHRRSLVTIGIGGAQGTGKSTMSGMLSMVLDDVFGLTSQTLSIDDFYLTHEDRQDLAARVHPMLAVRGVPGTHDMARMRWTIAQLGQGQSCPVPRFSKGDDDRLPDERIVSPAAVLILEGWCWGARPVAPGLLIEPVNELEAEHDPDGVWRRFVNDALASDDYQGCFDNDLAVFLAVPDMDAVFRWRLQAEQQLPGGQRVMDAEQIRRFIMYYERISRRMLADPVSGLIIRLGDDHGVEDISISD